MNHPGEDAQDDLPLLLIDLLERIDKGQPIPLRYRRALVDQLRGAATLDAALYADYYRRLGYPLSKSASAPGAVYNMAGLALKKSPSTIESSYKKHRDQLIPPDPEAYLDALRARWEADNPAPDAQTDAVAAESEEFRTDADQSAA